MKFHFRAMGNKRRYVLIGVIVFWVVLPVAVNSLLWRFSYRYASWRVSAPFGPDCKAYGRLIKLTTPEQIPYLIERVDESRYWWVEELLRCWFPVASESYPEQASNVTKQVFWSTWWENNKKSFQTLTLHYEPQF